MNHEELVRYVGRMKVQELTPETFDGFVSSAGGIFEPVGTRIEVHLRVGENSNSLSCFGEEAFKGGNRPKWDVFGDGRKGYEQAVVKVFEVRGKKGEEDHRFLFVDFERSVPYECFSMNHGELPWRFAFDEGKALYVAEHSGNGTLECPYESLFLRK
jgi:hypothetical protein